MNEWKKITYSDGSSLATGLRLDEGLQYFPNQYNDLLFCVGVPNSFEDKASQWYSDYFELHQHLLISKYGADDLKKILEEAHYQHVKQAWYFHDSSWYMRHDNGYDGKGCTADSCVPECEYAKPCLYPELFSLSKAEIDSNGQLLKRLFCLYSPDSDGDNKESKSEAGDQP